MPTLAEIAEAAEAAGLLLRGGFALSPSERTGPLASARCVALLGFAGGVQWAGFAASPEAQDGEPHSLDRWSRRVVTALAERLGATPLFPFGGPPYWPFQSWARAAEPVAPSPLGLMIHPRYGLWHSYRGALAFAEALPFEKEAAESPCVRCEGRPCLTACPVDAFTASGYDVEACAGWLRSPSGSDCLTRGCRARRACPVRREHGQAPEQARFHMQAFLAARG
jgi:hypothetical protein